MIYGDPIILDGGGSGGPDKVMTQGQVSNTSTYMTATFDSSIASYDFVEVHLFRAGADIGYQVISVPDSSVTFSIVGGYTYAMRLTPTTIACTNHPGEYVNLYVDVYAYNSAV